jgi:hypothetical protein
MWILPSGTNDWRTVPPGALEELLLLGGYAFELREGGRDAATRDLRHLLGSLWTADHDPSEFVSAMIEQGLQGTHPFWLSRYVATGRKFAADLWHSTDPSFDLASLPPRSFRVEFSRTFHMDGAPARLRMPLPIEDGHLTDLAISVEPPAKIQRSAGRIEAKVSVPAPGPVTLAASFSFTARPGIPLGADETPPGPGEWLSENEGPIQVTDRVRTLAASLDPDPSPAFDRVMAFRDYLIDSMACGMIHSECLSGSANIDWMLDNRWFDCRSGSALLAALCRARNIPARLVGGYLLWAAPTEHYWIEAWLPDRGWTPFDLLAWDLSAGGKDEAWRNVFAGTIDYRMKTQVFPNLFTGAPGVALTPPWHRLVRYIPDGAETQFISIPDGKLLYADRIRVFRE